jgi:hypothetical protein
VSELTAFIGCLGVISARRAAHAATVEDEHAKLPDLRRIFSRDDWEVVLEGGIWSTSLRLPQEHKANADITPERIG